MRLSCIRIFTRSINYPNCSDYTMNFLPMSWRNDRVGRKRESDESIHEIEAARKRTRPDEDSMGKKEGEAEADAEQRIFIPARSGACSSPRDALPSLPPQPVQIDRIVNFSDNNQDQEYPSGPWSKGPQYISSLPGHSERCKRLPSRHGHVNLTTLFLTCLPTNKKLNRNILLLTPTCASIPFEL